MYPFLPLTKSQFKTLEKNLLSLGAAYVTTLQMRGEIAERKEAEGTVASVIERMLRVADQLGQPNRDSRAVVDLLDDLARHIDARVVVERTRKEPYVSKIRVYGGR